jgi:(S)-sulfolactate dehydrogenase
MSKILVSEYLPDEYLDLLRTRHEVVYEPDLCTDRSRLLPQMAGVEALFTRNRTRVDEELIAAAPDLRVLGRLGVGLDNIDVNGCERAGVQVIPASGENAVSVAEYVIGAMLVVVRGVFGMTPSMIAGQWPRQGMHSVTSSWERPSGSSAMAPSHDRWRSVPPDWAWRSSPTIHSCPTTILPGEMFAASTWRHCSPRPM